MIDFNHNPFLYQTRLVRKRRFQTQLDYLPNNIYQNLIK